jgi:inner membrane protein
MTPITWLIDQQQGMLVTFFLFLAGYMDTLTHLALGACMGEAFAGRKLGKRGMLWGAAAHSLPDIDFLASFWLSTPANLLAHRGLTHSLLFGLLAAPVLALAAGRLQRERPVNWLKWLLFFGSVILLHDVLDTFNNYGVGWLEPFSQARISFNAVYVVDPFFSIWSLSACLALLLLKNGQFQRKLWSNAGLVLSGMYLFYCSYHKLIMDRAVREGLRDEKISYTRYFTTPAPLQNWLWYVVAGTDSGYYTTYRSVFDRDRPLHLHYFPRNSHWLAQIKGQADVRRLVRFSQQFYTVERRNDTLLFNDLRFGQVLGWQNPNARFVFHYFLEYPSENKLVVQRGRFSGWNWAATQSLYERIRGN